MPPTQGHEVIDTAAQQLPEYENPPVNEVVCGIHFASIDTLLVPHFGIFWERFKPEYPTCQQAAPLVSLIETFTGKPGLPQAELVDVPPLPRVWFVQKDGNGLIQLQRDRLLHNWRKLKKDDQYPRYNSVFAMFSQRLETFRAFLHDEKLGHIDPLQYEMTYMNHIFQGEGWDTTCDTGRVFPDFGWRQESRFLPCPEGVYWRTSFVLPDDAGRLHVTIRNGESSETGQPLYLLDMTVRGIGPDRSPEAMKSWFDTAREWIVRGFTDLTSPRIQADVWRRRR
jgi:uncharacterized protein (TIGR04255 family)